MELRSLRHFLAVAEELNFGRAAKRLFISQPGLSQSIRALEREIGRPLFERSRRHVALTSFGHVLLPEAEGLLAHAAEVEQLTKRLASRKLGTLVLNHTRSAGLGLPVQLTASFRKIHPHICVETYNGFTSLNVDKLKEKKSDVGFVRPPIDPSAGLRCVVIAEDEVVLAVPEDHPLAGKPDIDQADLDNEPLVYFPESAGGLWSTMLDAVYGHGQRPDISRVEPDETHMLAAVSECAGITLLTKPSAAIFNMPGVVIKPFRYPARVPLGLAWRPDNTNPALETFLSFVLRHERTKPSVEL
ncbi:LysR substrate-binding domain-containing protein [Nocardia sp. NPDC052566]|uniref:LysR substrate-binding domain-containing protein n=1 Tax=Nocardia sp. NPDC052566 TaxID=3364330 RepID=UPI0037C7E306